MATIEKIRHQSTSGKIIVSISGASEQAEPAFDALRNWLSRRVEKEARLHGVSADRQSRAIELTVSLAHTEFARQAIVADIEEYVTTGRITTERSLQQGALVNSAALFDGYRKSSRYKNEHAVSIFSTKDGSTGTVHITARLPQAEDENISAGYVRPAEQAAPKGLRLVS